MQIVLAGGQKTPGSPRSVSVPDFADWQETNASFESLGAYQTTGFTATGGEGATIVPGVAVTSGFFRVLDVRPLLGRTLNPSDDLPGSSFVAVIGEALWRERFGASGDILSKTLDIDGSPCRIVGVMKGDFQFPYFRTRLDVWAPLREAQTFRRLLTIRAVPIVNVIGRLRNGFGIEQANAEMATMQARLERSYPSGKSRGSVLVEPLEEAVAGKYRGAMWLLFAATAAILLICCANVACLLLSHITSRTQEFKIRRSLGAGRGVLIRQMAAQTMLLCTLGGAAGVLMAYWAVRALRPLVPPDLPRFAQIGVDGTVLVFTVAVTLICGIATGIIATAQATRSSNGNLHSSSRGRTSGPGRQRMLGGLIVSEVALAMLLMSVTWIFVKSLDRLLAIDPGFRVEHLARADVDLPQLKYPAPDQWRQVSHKLLAALSDAREISRSALVFPLPFTPSSILVPVSISGQESANPDARAGALYSTVTPGYFDVMGIPLLSGRAFSVNDKAGSPGVVLVDTAFVRRYLSGKPESPGRFLSFGTHGDVRHELVGVVGNIKSDSLKEPALPHIYVPFEQEPFWAMTIVAAGAAPASEVAHSIVVAVQSADSSLPVAHSEALADLIGETTRDARFRTVLLSIFGGLALLLAVVGIYGVLSDVVAQRIPEISMRMALGAGRRNILLLILGTGMRWTFIGLAIGAFLFLASERILENLLYGAGKLDPTALVSVAAILAAAALAAGAIPAYRATKSDPLVALRASQ